MKQYVVELTSEERYQLQQIVAKGNTTGYRIKYAQILLKADQAKGGPGWSDPKITEAFGCNLSTVYRLRKRLVENGFDAVLQHGNTGKRKQRKLDGKAEVIYQEGCSIMGKKEVDWDEEDETEENNSRDDQSGQSTGEVVEKNL